MSPLRPTSGGSAAATGALSLSFLRPAMPCAKGRQAHHVAHGYNGERLRPTAVEPDLPGTYPAMQQALRQIQPPLEQLQEFLAALPRPARVKMWDASAARAGGGT